MDPQTDFSLCHSYNLEETKSSQSVHMTINAWYVNADVTGAINLVM